jgi:hypothetical protein
MSTASLRMQESMIKQFEEIERMRKSVLTPSLLNSIQQIRYALLDALSIHERQMKQLARSVCYFQNNVRSSLLPFNESLLRYQQMAIDLQKQFENVLAPYRNSMMYLQRQVDLIKLDQKWMRNALEPILKLKFDIEPMQKNLNGIVSSMNQTFKELEISDFDLTDIEELNLDLNPGPEDTIIKREFSTSVTVSYDISTSATDTPKKKLSEITVEEFTEIIKKCISPKNQFSVAAFITFLYSDYAKDAVRVLLEITVAFMITLATGNLDAKVRAEIVNTVEESMVYKDMRKIIIKYVKVNPYSQIAFLRDDAYLRQGTSKNAPIVTNTKIKTNTVLTIIDRRNNWLLVQVDNSDSCGRYGWIQESKVVKFKKIK